MKASTLQKHLKGYKDYFLGFAAVGALGVAYFGVPLLIPLSYDSPIGVAEESERAADRPPLVAHVKTPEAVKAIYMSQCVVGTPTFRDSLVTLIEETELNAVVIDIKDYTGRIAFPSDNTALKDSVSDACGASDMKDFVKRLHEKGIYVIGRVTVFQDPYYTKAHPELAVHRASDGSVWKDYKGLSFVDVGARPFGDYIVTLSKEAYALGFDELNYDYIRFPSDGNMKDIYFSHSNGISKAEALEKFFGHLYSELKPIGVVLSADLFGMTATNNDDLNIGQVLERALPYFDYVAPMVYPSHYPSGFNGWKNPNDHVYDVVRFSMDRAAARTIATTTSVAGYAQTRIGTSTPAMYEKPAYDKLKMRPWLQDFDYGGDYDAADVRAQIQATYDAGLNSWMLWSPSNKYTRGALFDE